MTIDLSRYQRELKCAEAMGRLERPAYWQAFKRGLQRAFFGVPVVSEIEHEAWLKLSGSDDESRSERGAGYRDGYRMGGEATGRKE